MTAPHLGLLGDASSVHVQRWAREMRARGWRVSLVTARPAPIEGVSQIVLRPVRRASDWLWRVGEARRALTQLQPDLVIVDAESEARDALEHVVMATREAPRPIVMFTGDGSPESIRAATQAGVTSYVVDGLDPGRLRPILDVAVSRFEAHRALHDQLEQARLELSERKLIDQAKASLIRQTGASEPDVYREMRRAAMDRGLKLADIARQVLQKT